MCYNRIVIIFERVLIMFLDASKQEWTELYDIAKKTKNLKPWQYVNDDWILALDLPGREEPCYCIVTGQTTENYAIAIFPSEASLARYAECLDKDEDVYQAQCEQNY